MQIDFFTRPGCSLCADARELLQRVCPPGQWSEINVDADPALQAKYGEYVPVVEVDGVRVGQWRIEESRLRAALTPEHQRAPRRWFRRREAR